MSEEESEVSRQTAERRVWEDGARAARRRSGKNVFRSVTRGSLMGAGHQHTHTPALHSLSFFPLGNRKKSVDKFCKFYQKYYLQDEVTNGKAVCIFKTYLKKSLIVKMRLQN